jgi:alkane 1-monooxygenase
MGPTLLIALFALSPLPGLFWGAPWYALTPSLAFVVFPALDILLPKARTGTRGGGRPTPLLYLYLPYHAALILLGCRSGASTPIDSVAFWANSLSIGIVTGGTGITFAHEWVHKLKASQKLYGEWLLVWVGYGHYAIEHVYGHHKHVGTLEDGATARRDEWIQAYIPRALFQVWRGAYRQKPARTLAYGLATLSITGGIYVAYGLNGAVFFSAQAFLAVLLLTSIDFVEHYGLVRMKFTDGRTESVKPAHSWDSDTNLMGELLIHLQRHADHHMKPLKPYPELELLEGAPRLPTGYAGMIWLAWWPHLWFKVMNPRVDALAKAEK